MQRLGGLILSQHATDAEVEELLGGSLEAGLFYFNTDLQGWRTYTGRAWTSLPVPAQAFQTDELQNAIDKLRYQVNADKESLAVKLNSITSAVDEVASVAAALRSSFSKHVNAAQDKLQVVTNAVNDAKTIAAGSRTVLGAHVDEAKSKFTALASADEELGTTAKKIGKSLLSNTTTEIVDGVAVDETFELNHTAEAIVSIDAYNGTTGALIKLLNIDGTDYEHTSGDKVVTCKTDQSANILRVVYTRNSW